MPAKDTALNYEYLIPAELQQLQAPPGLNTCLFEGTSLLVKLHYISQQQAHAADSRETRRGAFGP